MVKCQCRRYGFDPWIGKILRSRKWQPIPVFLPGKFHGQRSLAGCSPWCRKESDTTEHAHKLRDALSVQNTQLQREICSKDTVSNPSFAVYKLCDPRHVII